MFFLKQKKRLQKGWAVLGYWYFVLGLLMILVQGSSADILDNWELRNLRPMLNDLMAVTYGDYEFIAVGNKGTSLVSDDGTLWGNFSVTNSEALYGIVYGGGLFVRGGQKGKIFVSEDGINWAPIESSVINDLYGVTCGNKMFVAVGGNSY